jgi:hypothetical protein
MTGRGSGLGPSGAEQEPFDRTTSGGEAASSEGSLVELGSEHAGPVTDIGTTWDDQPAARPFLPAFDGLDGLLLAAMVALLVFFGLLAPTALVFVMAVTPIAFGLSCAGAWFGTAR